MKNHTFRDLKSILLHEGITQAEVARHIKISFSAVTNIVKHHVWPKKNVPELKAIFISFLLDKGIKQEEVNYAISLVTEHPKRKTLQEILGSESEAEQEHAVLAIQKLCEKNRIKFSEISKGLPPEEEESMLLGKQTLTLEAKRHFGLFQNPFTNEVHSADELYLNSDFNYVRQALFQTAKHGGFIAISGESGSGKTTLKRDLTDRINREHLPILLIEPYIIATEDNDTTGKTLKSGHIAEAIINKVSSSTMKAKISSEARFKQAHDLLIESSRAGYSHVILIEEGHSLPIATLKHLKRFFELEDGFKKLISVVLIGQPELANKLSERNPAVREVVQRCESVTLNALDTTSLFEYIKHRLKKTDKTIDQIITEEGVEAIAERLMQPKSGRSLLYPLAIGNVLTGAMNLAASLGVPVVNHSVVMGV